MARLLKLAGLEARKRALVTESEVYRQTLKMELQNFQLYAAAAGRNLNKFKSLLTIIPIGGSLLGLLFAGLFRRNRRPAGLSGLWPTALMGWRFYQKFGPMLQPLLTKWMRRRRNPDARTEDDPNPEANI